MPRTCFDTIAECDMTERVKVFVRVRPETSEEAAADENCVGFEANGRVLHVQRQAMQHTFQFAGVFSPAASQVGLPT